MLFTKYSNINMTEIVEEGLSRTISKFFNKVSTKDIDIAFKNFQYKDRLDYYIDKVKADNPRKEFKDSYIDSKKPYSVDYKGYSLLPKLNDKGEIEEIYIYAMNKYHKYEKDMNIYEYKIWDKSYANKPDMTKVEKDPKLVEEVNKAFNDQFDYTIKLSLFGKSYELDLYLEDYKYYDAFEQAIHFIQDTIEKDLGRELNEAEQEKVFRKVQDELYKIAMKNAKRAENSKAGKAIGAKYEISKNKNNYAISIDYNFK